MKESSAAAVHVGAEAHPLCFLSTGHCVLFSAYKAVQLLLVCVKSLQGLAE